jgi:hypothetical protein
LILNKKKVFFLHTLGWVARRRLVQLVLVCLEWLEQVYLAPLILQDLVGLVAVVDLLLKA